MNFNKIFDATTKLALGITCVFLVGLIIALYAYTGVGEVASALFAPETIFAIELSLFTATVATALSIAISIPTAYALSRSNFRGKTIVDSLLTLPVVLPPVALGAMLLIFFTTPVGSTIESVFIKFTFQIPGIILAQLVVVSAFTIRILKSAFDDMDPEYEQVARTLGYGKFKTFYKVTLPICKNSLVAAAVLAWAKAIGEFGATVTLAGATRMKTETLPIAIFLNLARADVAQVAALILILIGIGLSAIYFFQKVCGSYRIW